MLYKLYVLYAPEHDKIFTGVTNSITDRMVEHNGNEPGNWTSTYKPWSLVHIELFNNEGEAEKRETFFETSAGIDYVRQEILPLFTF